MPRCKRLAVAVVFADFLSSFAVVAQASIPGSPCHVGGGKEQPHSPLVAGGGTELVRGGIGDHYVS